MYNFEKFNQILEEVSKIEIKNEKTFFEITRYPYRELVYSNILAFYFNASEEHMLGDSVLRAFIKAINKKINDTEIIINDNDTIDDFEIETEVTTENRKRMDFILHNDKCAIGIENKITASLNNDLREYANTINKKNINNYKVILSVVEEKGKEGFVNVKYSEFFQEIRDILDEKKHKENKWYMFLQDVMKTIENMEGNLPVNDSLTEWYVKNEEEIKHLIDAIKGIKQNLDREVDKLGEYLDEAILSYGEKTTRYHKGENKIDVLETICNIVNISVKDDLVLTIDNAKEPDGWEIRIFCTKVNNREPIRKILEKKKIPCREYGNSNLHLLLWDKFPNSVKYEKLVKRNIELLEIFKNEQIIEQTKD